jgi:thiol-disulfide isomerase/thioredoxin|tara:strand:- start:2164 stop:2790 length:627 start_codon:yes stop_codon:yes gene_type:complete
MNLQERKLLNKNFIIAGVIVLVIGLAVAIGVTLSSEPLDAGLPEGEVTISGDALPEFAGQNDMDVASGLPAPLFSAPNENSEIVSLDKNGNAKALLFLAHWCGYCQTEVPVVQNLINTVGVPSGVEIIAIATSIDRGRENYPPQKWLSDEGWSETQIYDLNREIGTAYGINAFPYWVFLDKDLNVVVRQTGNIPEEIVLAQLVQLANQ